MTKTVRHHEWDDDGCCIHCGFDGAEWHWWKHSTYEGRAHPEARMPRCLTPNELVYVLGPTLEEWAELEAARERDA